MKPAIEPVLKARDRISTASRGSKRAANVRRLQAEKPILGEMVAAGKLRVVGAYYDLPTGKVISV